MRPEHSQASNFYYYSHLVSFAYIMLSRGSTKCSEASLVVCMFSAL
jgi:hypothetical protein